jgi:hypothetical protein
MSVPKLEEGAAIAVISFAVLEVFRLYATTAPRLSDVRKAPKDEWETAQALLDADVMTGILVAVMGGAGIILMRRWYPLVFVAVTFVLVSGYYHAVRNSANSVENLP